MKRIGSIEINMAGAWTVRIDDRFMPSGTFALYISDEGIEIAREAARQAAEKLRGSSSVLRPQSALDELLSRPPAPWWRSFTGRWWR